MLKIQYEMLTIWSVITEIQNIFYCVDEILVGCCIYKKQLKLCRTHVHIR